MAGVTDNKGTIDTAAGGGVPGMVMVSFPAAGVVAGFDYNTPSLLSTVSVPGCDFLHTYYDVGALASGVWNEQRRHRRAVVDGAQGDAPGFEGILPNGTTVD